MSLKKKNAFSVRFIGGANIHDENENEWPTWPRMKINSVKKDKKPVNISCTENMNNNFNSNRN